MLRLPYGSCCISFGSSSLRHWTKVSLMITLRVGSIRHTQVRTSGCRCVCVCACVSAITCSLFSVKNSANIPTQGTHHHQGNVAFPAWEFRNGTLDSATCTAISEKIEWFQCYEKFVLGCSWVVGLPSIPNYKQYMIQYLQESEVSCRMLRGCLW